MNKLEEIEFLQKIYKNITKQKKPIAERLIEEAAFLKVELQKLQILIEEEGQKEWKTYTAFLKSYQAVIEQLNKLLPQEEITKSKEEVDPLVKFLKKAK